MIHDVASSSHLIAHHRTAKSDTDGERVADLLVLFDDALNLAEKHAALRARACVAGDGGSVAIMDDLGAAEYAARLWASARSFKIDDRIHDYPDRTIRVLRVYVPCQGDSLIRVQWPSTEKPPAAEFDVSDLDEQGAQP